MPSVGAAQDPGLRDLSVKAKEFEALSSVGESLKVVLRPEIGFPEEYVGYWDTAIDQAFAPDLLEADYLAALEPVLSSESKLAMAEFLDSDIGKEIAAIGSAADEEGDEAARVARGKAYLEAASPERKAQFDRLKASQGDANRADLIMDVYFRAMVIAATPIIGAEDARAWELSAGDLRTGYVEDSYLAAVAGASQLSEEHFAALIEAAETPEIKAYAEHSNMAFGKALHAAADRLEITYEEARNGN
ncbi:hypothetical protein M3484_16460 [Pseudomonas sp. GX19020]|uniref:hypothetical protein n=1 Tax=Pseudomonas sp. GX19020 TaxID=2942277 RepID=UPI0020187890|nr:hypothetical protein [Pseudomonas sp. GX19020]MCL4068165.1 hypothetical protein [Pseudomonas sp. GX19020]